MKTFLLEWLPYTQVKRKPYTLYVLAAPDENGILRAWPRLFYTDKYCRLQEKYFPSANDPSKILIAEFPSVL